MCNLNYEYFHKLHKHKHMHCLKLLKVLHNRIVPCTKVHLQYDKVNGATIVRNRIVLM